MNKTHFPDQTLNTISGNAEYNNTTHTLYIIQHIAHVSSPKRFLFFKYHSIRLIFIHHEDTLARLLQIYTDNEKQNDTIMEKKSPFVPVSKPKDECKRKTRLI